MHRRFSKHIGRGFYNGPVRKLEPPEKWELKAIFYLSLIHQAVVELPAIQPGFARQAAALNCRVRLVVRHRETSRAWTFGPDGVVALAMDEPVHLTLTFESFRLFVKVVEETTSPIRAILLGSIRVEGPLGLAYQFARTLSSVGNVLRLLREPVREGEEDEQRLAALAMFSALFQVFGKYIGLMGLPHPPVPWQLAFSGENRTVSLTPGEASPLALTQTGVLPSRQGAAWVFRQTLDLKLALDHPLKLVLFLITGRLKIHGLMASYGWVKCFIPFVRQVAPLLTGEPQKKGEILRDKSPSSAPAEQKETEF